MDWSSKLSKKKNLNAFINFLDCETNRDRFIKKCDVNSPIIIIIINKKDSIFGAYASNFSNKSGGDKWIGDKNALIKNTMFWILMIHYIIIKEPVEFIFMILLFVVNMTEK